MKRKNKNFKVFVKFTKSVGSNMIMMMIPTGKISISVKMMRVTPVVTKHVPQSLKVGAHLKRNLLIHPLLRHQLFQLVILWLVVQVQVLTDQLRVLR
jgi:hypothetical protein